MKSSDLDLPIREIDSFGKHSKVMLRLGYGIREGYIGEGPDTTLAEVLKLQDEDIKRIPYAGKKYIELFNEMKSELLGNNFEGAELTLNDDCFEPWNWETLLQASDSVALNRSSISSGARKALAKIEKCGLETSVRGIIATEKEELLKIEGIGQRVVENFLNVQRNCINELKSVVDGEIDIQSFQSPLLVPIKIDDLALEDLDRILLEDVDQFLEHLSEIENTVFCSRLGFTQEKVTLKDIGDLFNVTRERIRQIEIKVCDRFIAEKRLSGTLIAECIENNLSSSFVTRFPLLAECFDKEGDLVSFLEMCGSGIEIKSRLKPSISYKILDPLFSSKGFPISKSQILEYLEPQLGEEFNLEMALDLLVESGNIRIDMGQYYPTRLPKPSAVASILANNPAGLPWKDVARIANINKITKTQFDESRSIHSVFTDSDDVYLCGKGLYRHTKFLGIEQSIFDKIISEVKNRLILFPRDAAHLSELFSQSEFLKQFDYYGVRYIIKIFGEDEGVYFCGKSQTDTVSLEKNSGSINQKEVILQKLATSQSALTKAEIAQLLKSKSLLHAGFYIDELARDKKIVQVDRMLYTTPEKAFDGIDFAELGYFLKEEIFKSERAEKYIYIRFI